MDPDDGEGCACEGRVLLTQHWPKNTKFKKTLVHQIKRNINKVVSVFTLESPEGEKCRPKPDR